MVTYIKENLRRKRRCWVYSKISNSSKLMGRGKRENCATKSRTIECELKKTIIKAGLICRSQEGNTANIRDTTWDKENGKKILCCSPFQPIKNSHESKLARVPLMWNPETQWYRGLAHCDTRITWNRQQQTRWQSSLKST